jgi:putative heme-binding domain-containing protein
MTTPHVGGLARFMLLAACLAAAGISRSKADEMPGADDAAAKLFARENLVAWCIVPFDAKKRGPEERADMLERLGFKRFAYDWRTEHIASFDDEMAALKRHGITLEAFWFPAALNDEAHAILEVLRRNEIRTQLWITMGDPAPGADSPSDKVKAAANVLRPIADEAAAIGCSLALYNHGGWFGEPENQLAVIDELKPANVGIVYSLHHGHGHLDRFPTLLKLMLPKLVALNLNGMYNDGERLGKKIVPLGQGPLDLELLKTISASGYRGPIGILGHTTDDAEERLRDNLDGLDWLVPQLDGKPAGPKPRPRTYVDTTAARMPGARGWLAAGKPEYRTLPLTVECKARLDQKQNYNILTASDSKQSPAHWELFSMAGSGTFTAYLPGMEPDHIRSQVVICDSAWHDLAAQFEAHRVRLYCDGKLVCDQTVRSKGRESLPGGLAFGRLVEGGLGCEGQLDFVRISRGVRENLAQIGKRVEADDETIGLWRFQPDRQTIEDLSKLENAAEAAAASAPSARLGPPTGPQLKSADERLKVVLIDRSENDAFMAVKADSLGRLFVGGREAVFVFEPDKRGGYRPRQELYRFPPDSIIIGLELRGNDLYVLTASALYLFPDGRTRREALQPKRLLWGLPLDLHVSFHCLAWGPEGDLYLNHGDPLLNYGDWGRPDHWGHWTLHCQPEGTTVPYTGAGAVLRAKPDGSDLRVVAGGLRGPVGLAFDGQWNLFTNDNDHESRADRYAPARLLHVTPHVDFAWPRGWLPSKSPDRADLLETMNPNLGRGVPCDMVNYDEPFFPDDLRNSLLMCRWDRMAVNRYRTRPRGASFEADELPFLTGENDVRPVGVTVGRGGRVFVTSLYLSGNVVSPYCASDLVMITRADDPPERPFEPYEIAELPLEALWAELSSDSCQRRQRAHVEILRRGGAVLAQAPARLVSTGSASALPHLIWLAAAEGGEFSQRLLSRMAHNPHPECRSQAARALAEFPRLRQKREMFIDKLGDADPAVRLAALAYFLSVDEPPPAASLVPLVTNADSYLRQTACLLLARRAPIDDILVLSRSRNAAERLAGVLSAGMKLTTRPSDDVPPAELPLFFPPDNAFFHTAIRFADDEQTINLAALGRVGSYTSAERWNRLPHTLDEKKMFNLLVRALDDAKPAVQLQAAYYLSLLGDPRAEPLVANTRRNVKLQELSALPPRDVIEVWSVGAFDDRDGALAAEQAVVDLSAEYNTREGVVRWEKADANGGRFDWGGRFSRQGRSSYYVAFRLQALRRQAALVAIEGGNAIMCWHNGMPVENGPTEAPGPAGALLEVQPGSNDILVRVHSKGEAGSLRLRLHAAGDVVAELPERLDRSLLATRLAEAAEAGGSSVIAPEFLATDWQHEAHQGDAVRGRKLFGALGCVKCHAITAEQTASGAPSLAEARKRFTVPYLVESVLLPSRQVVEIFRSTTIETTDGHALTGLIVREAADEIELLLPDATRKTVKVETIESRQSQPLSPMPSGIVKTPAELRDLLAYLLSEHPQPP